MDVSVYCLSDPRTGEVRYVGYSKYPELRFASHCKDAGNTHKARWIMKLHREAGLRPALSVQCVVETAAEAKQIEVALIARHREQGARLTNGTAGGDGVVGRYHTEEEKRKIGDFFRGRQRSSEHLAALAASAERRRGKSWGRHTEETKKRIGKAAQGLRPNKARQGKDNPFFGKTHSDETRKRISAAKQGKVTGANNPFFGKHHSEDARIKMHRSQKRRRWNELFAETARLQPQLMRSLMITSRLLQTAQAKEN